MSQTAISQRTLEQFRGVMRLIRDSHIRSDERAKAAHERFNIFLTLLKDHDEVRLHTRFLHCLLDPKGRHDCGSLFLDLFFNTLDEFPGLDHEGQPVSLNIPSAKEQWSVGKEVQCPPHGQLDFLIELPGFKIAIENKIYAGEQPRQLACYAEYLGRLPADHTRLIYLTLDGKASETAEGAPYIRISYAKHVLAWLDKCLRESYRTIPINQGICQYLDVVRQITGKTIQLADMKPIADFIALNPDIIRFRQQLDQGIEAARAALLDRIADGIVQKLNGQNGMVVQLRDDHKDGRFGIDPYGNIIITPPTNGRLKGAPFKIYVEHDTDLNSLVVGIAAMDYETKSPKEHVALFRKMNELMNAYSDTKDYHKAAPNLHWPVGWHDMICPIDDKELSELLEKPLETIVDQVCIEIQGYIVVLESVYVEASSISKIKTT